MVLRGLADCLVPLLVFRISKLRSDDLAHSDARRPVGEHGCTYRANRNATVAARCRFTIEGKQIKKLNMFKGHANHSAGRPKRSFYASLTRYLQTRQVVSNWTRGEFQEDLPCEAAD